MAVGIVFWARDIVRVVCAIVLLKGSKRFMRDLARTATEPNTNRAGIVSSFKMLSLTFSVTPKSVKEDGNLPD